MKIYDKDFEFNENYLINIYIKSYYERNNFKNWFSLDNINFNLILYLSSTKLEIIDIIKKGKYYNFDFIIDRTDNLKEYLKYVVLYLDGEMVYHHELKRNIRWIQNASFNLRNGRTFRKNKYTDKFDNNVFDLECRDYYWDLK